MIPPAPAVSPLTQPLARLIQQFERLPVIGPRTAQHLSLHLLRQPQEQLEAFAAALLTAKRSVGSVSSVSTWRQARSVTSAAISGAARAKSVWWRSPRICWRWSAAGSSTARITCWGSDFPHGRHDPGDAHGAGPHPAHQMKPCG